MHGRSVGKGLRRLETVLAKTIIILYYTHVRVYVKGKSTYSHVLEDRQSGQI